jgi:hypothetical protein
VGRKMQEWYHCEGAARSFLLLKLCRICAPLFIAADFVSALIVNNVKGPCHHGVAVADGTAAIRNLPLRTCDVEVDLQLSTYAEAVEITLA